MALNIIRGLMRKTAIFSTPLEVLPGTLGCLFSSVPCPFVGTKCGSEPELRDPICHGPDKAYLLYGTLLMGLEDSDWRVREYCSLAICRFGFLSRSAIPLMIANLSHSSGMLRGWTVNCLGYLSDVARPAVPYLVEMLRKPETFDSGWSPAIAVEAINHIMYRKFNNTEEVLEWWKDAEKWKW